MISVEKNLKIERGVWRLYLEEGVNGMGCGPSLN